MCCLLAAYGRTHAPNVTWKDVSPSLPLSGTHITGEHGPTWSQIALFLKCHSAVSLPEIVHESREYVPYSLPTSVPIETHAKNEKKKPSKIPCLKHTQILILLSTCIPET